MKHATDKEIQEFSLGNIADPMLVEHIKNSSKCSEAAKQYNMMFEAIKQQAAPAFDFNVTQLVMEQLPVKKSADKFFIYCSTGAAISTIAVLFYVIKVYLPSVFHGLTPMLAGLIIIAGLGVLLSVAIDMYKKYMEKMDALNFS
jgi:hypothetical protein